MMGRVEGKVAFITGAARGQGRSHAHLLAAEGADIIAVDICKPVDSVKYPLATMDDLAETVRMVEAIGGRIVASAVDVRDLAATQAAVDEGVAKFGRLDIVSINHGISSFGPTDELSEDTWNDMIDVNLTGVWHAAKAAIPHIKVGGRGGAIVITSSGAGVRSFANIGHYAAAKHGTVGLMRTLALELAPHWIRVNCILPSQVDSPMIMNDDTYRLFRPDLENPTAKDMEEPSILLHALPVAYIDPIDISNALLFLVSDDARYITGVPLPVDAGGGLK